MSNSLIRNLSSDLPASVVVFLVALPLCLGIALASGAPLYSGVLSGVIGGVVVGTLSKSPISVSGPAAGLTSIVFVSIAELGSFPVFLCCVVLAGLLQILFGYLKAGTIGHFVPVAVIRGMLAAIGLILILKQLPHAVGYDVDFEGDESFLQTDGKNTFTDVLEAFNYVTPGAVVVGLVSIIVLLVWEKQFFRMHKLVRYLPGALVVVLLGIMLNWIFTAYAPALQIQSTHLVNFSDKADARLGDMFTFPDVTKLADRRVYIVAFTLALVASLETLLSIEAADKLDPFKRITPLNHELKAQGLANVISGLIGGLPVTSVIVRTSANVASGAKSKISTISHALLLIMAVVLFPHFLETIPLASLAAILILVGYKLASLTVLKEVYAKGKSQFIPFCATVIAILFSDLLTGVLIGILVSLFFVLKSNFRSAVVVVDDGSNYLLKFSKDVSFLNKSSLRSAFEKIPNNVSLIIDGSNAQFIDQDIIATLEDFIVSAPTKNIAVEIKKSNRAMNAYFRND